MRISSPFFLVQFITSLRVAAAILFVAIAVHAEDPRPVLVLYLAGLATDAFDGLAARHFRVSSPAGSAYDGFADKSMTVATVLYAAAIGAPLIACALVLQRDLFVLSFRSIAGERAVLSPSKWKGMVTGAPAKTITALILACPIFAPDVTISLSWYWLAGAMSSMSVLRDVWIDRRAIARHFRNDASGGD